MIQIQPAMARRELLGPAAFSQIDLPRASMMLAQAAGRLIRTSNDRGVVRFRKVEIRSL